MPKRTTWSICRPGRTGSTSESLGGATLPRSLYLTDKPAWFGDLPWPPFGPDTEFEKNKIPAQVRFEAIGNL